MRWRRSTRLVGQKQWLWEQDAESKTERGIDSRPTQRQEVEEDKARETEFNGREDVPMAIYAIQRRRKALCLVP